MNKFLDQRNLIKSYNNLNDMIRNSKQSEFKVFNTRNRCYKLAIDTMLYAHKFKYSYDDIIYGFTNQIINFLNNRILPIYIIDGIAPEEKQDLIKSRNDKKCRIDKKIDNLKNLLELETDDLKKKQIIKKINNLNRSNIKISKEDIDDIITLLDNFNIPYIRAKGEADALIGVLYEKNLIDSCLSEDMDILIFGCRKMIKFHNKKIYEYDLDFILKNLEISFNQYLEMCIFFGCDYLKPIFKICPNHIYESIYKNESLNLLKDQLSEEGFNKYIKKFNKTKLIFLNSKQNELESCKNINFQIKSTLNIQNVLNFLNEKCNFNLNKINDMKYDIIYINNLISDNKFF